MSNEASLTRRVLQNRHAAWALVIAIAAFGALGYQRLPMQLFPDTAPPLVNVITVYPGAAATDVATNVSRVLEEEFNTLEGVVRVKSSSQEGMSLVSVEFRYWRDVELAAVDVQNAVAAVRGNLPEGIGEPRVLKFSTDDRPIATFGIAAGDLADARTFAEDVLKPLIQRVDGVAAVDVFGGHKRAVMLEIEARELQAHRISFQRVVDTVARHNTAMPAGNIRTEYTQSSFRVESRAPDLDALRNIPIVMEDGARVLIGDLGRVRYGTLDDDSAFAVDGRTAIAVQIFKTTEANTVAVVDRVTDLLNSLAPRYAQYTFLAGEESASFTRISIANLLQNIWQALFLAGLIIFLSLARWGTSAAAIAAMVLSYAATFALMQLTGTELNMVTLTAVILAVGMVVDAAVVVLENIEVRRAEGLPLREAIIRGTDEIRLPVIAGGATTLAVLLPLLFLPGFVGKTFGPLAKTLLFAFSSSLLIALFIVPVFALRAVKPSRFDGHAERIARPFTWLLEKTRHAYGQLLAVALRRRALTLALVFVLFVGALAGLALRGANVLPAMDSGSFYVSLETPPGTSLAETFRVVHAVEEILRDEPEVIKIQSQAGFEAGMRSFVSDGVQGATQGFISVTLTPRTARKESTWSIQARVRERLHGIPGITSVAVKELGNTAKSTTTAPVLVRISGEDPLVLDLIGDEVLTRLQALDSLVEPRRTWRIDLAQTQVMVDTLRAGRLGLSPAGVAAQLQAGTHGLGAGEYHGGEAAPLPVWVRYERTRRPMPDDLLRMPLFVPGALDPVPLRTVASLKTTQVQGLVTRDESRPALEITAYLAHKPLNFTILDVKRALQGLELPLDYEVELVGENRDMGEAASALGGAFLFAILAVYLLLSAQLRSFLHPLTIMMTVPLSLVGVSAALWIAGKTLSMPVMVGMVLLVGIVVNNAIILLDFVQKHRGDGLERRQALQAAVAARFRPIMMTSLSTIVGMIPLAAEWALGAERFAPLATAVIGGMTVGTLLTLVVIPVIYDVFESVKTRVGGKPTPEAVEQA